MLLPAERFGALFFYRRYNRGDDSLQRLSNCYFYFAFIGAFSPNFSLYLSGWPQCGQIAVLIC